ncbi:MAG: DUF6524 family protein [Pikeienuella sp.]
MFSQNIFVQLAIRIGASILVVLLTYNPSGYSYVDWVRGGAFENDMAMVVLAGLVLVVAYVVLARATLFSIGVAGVALVAALIAALVWVLVEYNILSLTKPGVIDWIVLIGLGFILGIGLSWAIVRRRLSGQVYVDDVQDS